MNKDFVTVATDSGSGNGHFSVVCAKNNTGEERNTVLNVAGGGITKTVNIKQFGLNLQGMDVQLICNGATYAGIIDADCVYDDVREINIKLQHVLSAGGKLIDSYLGYVYFNIIGGTDANKRGLPTFTKIYYAEESDITNEIQSMDIAPKPAISSTFYGPTSESNREDVASIINKALIGNSADQTYFVLKNDTCRVIIEFEPTIQAIEIDGKIFVGNEDHFEARRTFALLGNSPENNPEYINLYQADVARIARLAEVRFDYHEAIVPNVYPNVLKNTFASYLIANSSDQTEITNALEYLSNRDVILNIIGEGAEDNVTLTNNVTIIY